MFRGRVFIFKIMKIRKSWLARGNYCQVSKNVSNPTLNPSGNAHMPLPCSKTFPGSLLSARQSSVPGTQAATWTGTSLSHAFLCSFPAISAPQNCMRTLRPDTVWAFLPLHSPTPHSCSLSEDNTRSRSPSKPRSSQSCPEQGLLPTRPASF